MKIVHEDKKMKEDQVHDKKGLAHSLTCGHMEI
jgi:hypothetical protein